MAQDTTVDLAEGVWTQLTNAAAASITFQNTGRWPISVKVTVTAAAPTDFDGAIVYKPGTGERNATLSDLAPGIAGTRVYAYPRGGAGTVTVSHG